LNKISNAEKSYEQGIKTNSEHIIERPSRSAISTLMFINNQFVIVNVTCLSLIIT